MKHIFYLHSNICVIAAYDTIISLIDKGEEVIVVSERNTKFPICEDKIRTYDIEPIIDKYRKKTSNHFLQVINYRFNLIPRYKKFAEDVINDEDFEIYIPSYSMYTVFPFLRNRHCKGYYFVEEGTLSYLTTETLRNRYLTRRFKRCRIFLDLIGAGETPDYKITKYFKGCLCLSEKSFPWCKDNRIKTGFDGYYSNYKFEDPDIEHLIITDYLRSDKDVIVQAFKIVIDRVLMQNTSPKIGIKFHPTAYMYEAEKVEKIMAELFSAYPKINFVQLPAPYSVEVLMYHRKIYLYSVFNISSLLLYGLMLNSESNMLLQNEGDIRMVNIPTIEDFIELSNQRE